MPRGQVEKETDKGVPLKSLVTGRGCTKGDGAAPALGHQLVAGSGSSLLFCSPSPVSMLLQTSLCSLAKPCCEPVQLTRKLPASLFPAGFFIPFAN